MKRTTILLPADLKYRAEWRAREEGMSLAEMVREALEQRLHQGAQYDPFFADSAVFAGDEAEDVSSEHDFYLYETSQPEAT